MDVTVLFIFVVVFLLSYYILKRRRNLPPGPMSIPVLGSVFFLNKMSQFRPHQVMVEAAKKYGDVMSFRMGPQLIVALNGYDMVHEALVKHADVFSGRPMFWKVFERGLSDDGVLARGVLFNQYGQSWRTLRRFTLQVLRDFGVGKTSIEEKILTETDAVTKVLEKTGGKPVDIDLDLQGVISNVIFGIVFGRRYDYEDQEFHRVSRLTRTAISGAGNISIGNFLPDFLVRIIDKEEGARNIIQIKSFKQMRDYILQQVDDHEATYDKENIRDFIDLYIRTIREGSEEEKQDLDRQNIFRVILDLFFAGLTTTSTTLSWAFLYMSEFPDVQKKCQNEIAEVFGEKTMHYADRGKLVYVEATLCEIQRHATIAPLNGAHFTLKDITFHGYNIPKDTMIIPPIWAVNYDPKYWENPTEFKPERFIDDSGKLIKNDALMPFGTGPRQCLGEPLARMELFLVFANLLQRFRFKPENEAVPHSLESMMHQVTNIPLPYKVRVTRRA